MGKVNVTVLVVVGIIVLAIVYMLNQRNRLEMQTRAIEGQTALINAQTAQQTACQSSWVCATGNILSGLGGVAANLNLGSIFGGDKD
jgi:predicted ABC-type sugar transport system permease subunit